MKQIVDAIRRALRDDPIIVATVGLDKDGETKVYQGLGKTNVEAPYIVLAVIPGVAPDGVYGDDYVVQNVMLQATAWGRNANEAWQVAEVIQDAFEHSDYSVEPWELMRVRRGSFPREMTDRDTNMIQVNTDYVFRFSR